MVALFALIGIGCALWFISKACIKIGTALEKIGDEIAMNAMSARNVNQSVDRGRAEELREKVLVAKGEKTDKQYWNQVREEIDEITGEE